MTTKYERQREERIAANKRKLAEMGLEDAARQLEGQPAKRQGWGPDLLERLNLVQSLLAACHPGSSSLACQCTAGSPAPAGSGRRSRTRALTWSHPGAAGGSGAR